MVAEEPFNTANLKLTKPTDHLPEREMYEKLCRYLWFFLNIYTLYLYSLINSFFLQGGETHGS